MPTDWRFVFDTSAIVSAVLLKQSVVRQSFDKAAAQGKLLISQAFALTPSISGNTDRDASPVLGRPVEKTKSTTLMLPMLSTHKS